MTNQNLLRDRRLELGLTMKQVADAVGVSEATVSRWESGEIANMRRSRIVKLAAALNLSPIDIMNSDGDSLPANSDVLPPNILPLPKTYKVPLLGSIVSGTPILAPENIETYIDVPDDIRCDFSLRCKGDCMLDMRINNGDIVYIRQQPDVESGEIAAVLIDGTETETEVMLKRVFKAENHITLMTANNNCEPLVFLGEDMKHVHIIGKAVAFVSVVR